MEYRIERDAIGQLEVPIQAYYGIFTERAKNNFRISGIKADRQLIKALAMIKKAAAQANLELGVLDANIAAAIIESANEVAEGKWDAEFPLDVFQAGAGTPFNMNCNEVIANLATEKLGGKKGQYKVHPNNHVNMAQSSNDVIPTAIRIAVILSLPKLEDAISQLKNELETKKEKYAMVVKTGRTHLQDAVPITFGQVFGSYANAMSECTSRINQARKSLAVLGIGGTAIGTGINTHPKFKEKIIEKLSGFTQAKDSILTTWSAAPFLEMSGALRILACETIKISNDLMLLNSGPKTAIAEIILPEAEPGSSIMPGKVNPSIPECAIMACYQALGNDHSIELAAKSGQMELNVMTPLIGFDLIWTIHLLANTLQMLSEFALKEMKVDEERSKQLLDKGLSLVTALNPYIGYEVAAEIVKISLAENKPLTEVIIEHRIMGEDELAKVLDAKAMTEPGQIDKELATKIQNSQGFKLFKAHFLGAQ